MGVDNSLRLESFCENFKIEVIRLTKDEIEFDMIGIDASLANAFRRILIAEVGNHMKISFLLKLCRKKQFSTTCLLIC